MVVLWLMLARAVHRSVVVHRRLGAKDPTDDSRGVHKSALMDEKAMLSLRSVLAGSGALLALYIGWYVYLLYTYRYFPLTGRQRAFGVEGLAVLARAVLLSPAFWLAAVAVFLVVAYLARK